MEAEGVMRRAGMLPEGIGIPHDELAIWLACEGKASDVGGYMVKAGEVLHEDPLELWRVLILTARWQRF